MSALRSPAVAHLCVGMVVHAPVEHTWELLTAWERQGEWMPATRVRSEYGRQVGGQIRAWSGLGPVGFLDSMTITRWEPPRLCEVVHDGRFLRGPGLFRVDPAGAGPGSRVVWEEHLELPLGAAGQLGWVVARPLARAALTLALRRFAALAQSSS